MEEYRKIAILMDSTNYKIQDICRYLDAEYRYWKDEKLSHLPYEKYLTSQTSLAWSRIVKIERAYFKLQKGSDYPLAKEYAMMVKMVAEMEKWTEFIEINPEFYQNTLDYLDLLGNKIIEECQTSFAFQCEDLMKNGKIDESRKEDAIERYMAANSYKKLNSDNK